MAETDQEGVEHGDTLVDGFYFVGDVLALDLVNTEIVVRGQRRDLLAAPGAAMRWWRAAQARHADHAVALADSGPPDVADDALLSAALLTLRLALRGIFGALAQGEAPAVADIERLNATLGTGRPALELLPDGAARLTYRCADAAAAVLLPIAHSALRLATEGQRARLRACGNGRCILLFYDTTKSGTRRWCSAGCKDRDRKMKRYHQRVAAG